MAQERLMTILMMNEALSSWERRAKKFYKPLKELERTRHTAQMFTEAVERQRLAVAEAAEERKMRQEAEEKLKEVEESLKEVEKRLRRAEDVADAAGLVLEDAHHQPGEGEAGLREHLEVIPRLHGLATNPNPKP